MVQDTSTTFTLKMITCAALPFTETVTVYCCVLVGQTLSVLAVDPLLQR